VWFLRIALLVGARISSLAGPGEILVSSTVEDLIAGFGLRFEDRGEISSRGSPKPDASSHSPADVAARVWAARLPLTSRDDDRCE